jgi:hypothetical protein
MEFEKKFIFLTKDQGKIEIINKDNMNTVKSHIFIGYECSLSKASLSLKKD